MISLGVLLLACPAPSVAVDAGVPPVDAGVDAGVALWVDGGARAAVEPQSLKFQLLAMQRDGGTELVIVSGLRAEVEPAKALVLVLEQELADYRVRLLDAQEQIPPSDDEAVGLDGGLQYRIMLAAPLRPGRAYALTVEAELGADLTDVRGARFRDLRIELKVRGEPEPERAPWRPERRRRKP